MLRPSLLPALLLLVTTACSSVYMPRRGPRVSLTMETGGLAIVRQGRLYPVGFLGGGISDALGDLPLARDFGAVYEQRSTFGLIALVAGGAGLIVAPTTALFSRDENAARNAGLLLLGSLTAYVAGACLLTSAQPYLYDAVNAANDELEAAPVVSPTSL
jgi:hypothetical protein